MRVCPECGSIDLLVLPDESGKCRACGRAFVKPVSTEEFRGATARDDVEYAAGMPEAMQGSAWDGSELTHREATSPWDAAYLLPRQDVGRKWEANLRKGGLLAFVGAIFFAVAIPISLYILLIFVRLQTGQNISFGDFLDHVQGTDTWLILVTGVAMQILFSLGAVTLGVTAREGS